MADLQTTPPPPSANVIPMKRPLDEDHTPTVSSPLNPDAIAKAKQAPPARGREPREKKDSLKKRESSNAVKEGTPVQSTKKQKGSPLSIPSFAPSPIRYNHALPRDPGHYQNKEPTFASHEPEPFYAPDGVELKRPLDYTENKKSYRYSHCVADPTFPHMRYYRQSDEKPFGPRMSFEDSDKWFHFDESGTYITNEKGWRLGRANVVAREGTFYYEVKILRGVPAEGPPVPPLTGPLPHVRVGWARREAPLDCPIGFDGYSYGVTDIRLEPMHKSRASKFLDLGTDVSSKKQSKSKSKSKYHPSASTAFAANDHIREGDVVGLSISLPSLALHRKVVDGNYNPAIDIGAGFDTTTPDEEGSLNIVRDRFPVPYKGAMYFETVEYRASKSMEAYGDRGPFSKETPSTNHSDPTLRLLPHSNIKVYKNGKCIGTAFRDLMAFLPPASAPVAEKGVRTGCDDGMLGYFPAVSVFSGGVAQVNFGPDFWCPPEDLASANREASVKKEDEEMMDTSTSTPAASDSDVLPKKNKLRGIGERFAEQVGEDIYYDIVDEVDFFVQDGARTRG